jgi:hypothetical protein
LNEDHPSSDGGLYARLPRDPVSRQGDRAERRPLTRGINGRLDYVAGVSERPDADGRYTYAVYLYDLSRFWCCAEAELENVPVDWMSSR